MSNIQATAAMAPFWGKYILRPMQETSEKGDKRADREREEKIRKLFEMIDDYVEQA